MTRRTGPTQAVRDGVFLRDGSCVICGETYQLQVHHRRARGMGSTRRPETNGAANLILLCSEHHQFVESHRDTARHSGYLVRQHADPALSPIIYKGAWSWLADDFTVTPLGASDLAARDVLISDTSGEQDGAA